LSLSAESDPTVSNQTGFDRFWKTYPRHEKKKNAREIWKRKKLDQLAEQITADVTKRISEHGAWLDGFIPHATTYLNGERWNDEIVPKGLGTPGKQSITEKNQQAILEALQQTN